MVICQILSVDTDSVGYGVGRLWTDSGAVWRCSISAVVLGSRDLQRALCKEGWLPCSALLRWIVTWSMTPTDTEQRNVSSNCGQPECSIPHHSPRDPQTPPFCQCSLTPSTGTGMDEWNITPETTIHGTDFVLDSVYHNYRGINFKHD